MERKEIDNVSFEEKYAEFLNGLKSMPKGMGTREEKRVQKEARLAYLEKFRKEQKEEYDNFVIDLMYLYKPGSVRELKKRLGSGDVIKSQMIDSDIVFAKRPPEEDKELDYVVFMDAFTQAIKDYTGVTQAGDKLLFVQCVGKKYRHIAQAEAGKTAVSEGGVHVDTPMRNQHYILRLVKTINEIMKRKGGEINLRDAVEEALQEIPKTTHQFTKAEIDRAVQMVEELDITRSLDQPVSKKDGERISLIDTITDKKDPFENVEDHSFVNSCLQEMVRHFEEKWEAVKSAAGKRNIEWIKIFMSKDILILLKLYALSEEEKRYGDEKYIEPNCGQWCHRRKRCKIKENKRTGCYIRYGKLMEDVEAGDGEIYDILKSQEEFFYKSVLKNDYIDFAFRDKIESLYDIYAKQMKDFGEEEPENCFRFTDAVIARVQGKDKNVVSRYRKRYETETREELSDIFYRLS